MRFLPLALVALMGLGACSGAAPPASTNTPPGLAPAPPSGFADPFANLMNTERGNLALGPLSQDAKLAQAAQGHATDMSINSYFSHTSLDGRKMSDRIAATGYDYCWAGENIAQGHPSQSAVFSAWMNSAGHRANMMSSQATEFGLARAPGNYWVLLVARPGC